MAVEVVAGGGFSTREPRVALAEGFKEPSNTNTPFDVMSDGRFLGVRLLPDANVLDRIDVVLHWFTQLPKR